MVWVPDGEKSLRMCSFSSTQYKRVTGQIDTGHGLHYA